MKLIFFILLFCCRSAFSGESIHISISDVVNRVSQNNLKVYESAMRVYQAKTNIEKARYALLPKLNIWNIAKLAIDPSSAVDSVSDIAPFLIPANWFRKTEIKLLYLAEKEGYKALWANEVNIAKTLYSRILYDQSILNHVDRSIDELQKIHRMVQTRETFGGVKPGVSRDIEIRLIGLKEDKKNLINLINFEINELSNTLGYPANTEITLNTIPFLKVENLKPIQAKDYESKTILASPERKQFDYFLSVMSQIKKEVRYSFFGGSSISRGVAGGIFDSFFQDNGLGFGSGSTIKIIKTQGELIKKQKYGIEEVLKRQIKAAEIQFNSDLESLSNLERLTKLVNESKLSLLRRMQIGEDFDVIELSEASRNCIQAESALLTIQFRLLTLVDRLNRLLFEGDYSLVP